jgi:hypothetical protein
LRSYESFKSARDGWIKDIMFFRDQCALKNQWKDLTVDDSADKAAIEADVEDRKMDRLRNLDMDQ